MSDRKMTLPVAALRKFRAECKAEGLGIECAIATLALAAIRMDDAMRDGTWQMALSHIGNLRKEIRNVKGALKKEGYQVDWSQASGEAKL